MIIECLDLQKIKNTKHLQELIMDKNTDENKFAKADEMLENFELIKISLVKNVEDICKRMDKFAAAVKNGNYKKSDRGYSENYYHDKQVLWSTDGQGLPVIDAETVDKWGDTHFLVQEFFEDFAIDDGGAARSPIPP
jgi:hypothetical protein